VPHVALFQKSQCCQELTGFIQLCVDAVKSSKMSETKITEVSDATQII
jgi:hypothetical protein